MKKIGLRIDVDTFRGTQRGIPQLLELLAEYEILATFFISVGPDNMGRHLWHLLRPNFLLKMLRTRAHKLYGWDILLAGTAWPGKNIGSSLGHIIRSVEKQGHEVGLHAWDHYSWQVNVRSWTSTTVIKHISRGVDSLAQILGRQICCSAAPGWRADQRIIELKENFNFVYNSDCRGYQLFRPRMLNGNLGTIQIPVTLPTFDEVMSKVISSIDYNSFILALMKQQTDDSVYTIHAEVEGILLVDQFKKLLDAAKKSGIYFCQLNKLLPMSLNTLPVGRIVRGPCSGRLGWVGCQSKEYSANES